MTTIKAILAKKTTRTDTVHSRTDSFGTNTKCPSQRDVRLIESQIKGVLKRGRDRHYIAARFIRGVGEERVECISRLLPTERKCL